MTTRGVADIVFCLDASDSMSPCFAGVREHVGAFVESLKADGQRTWDLRMDFLAYNCSLDGRVNSASSMKLKGLDLLNALYAPQGQSSGQIFTSSIDEFRSGLSEVTTEGNEAPLVGLDTALDFPWRPSANCHRVVIQMTDEPFETGAALEMQRARLDDLIKKIQELRVMLFLVGPESGVFSRLAEVDRCEYSVVDQGHDGLKGVDFREVLSFIGKSVSVSSLQQAGSDHVKRGLFGQAGWKPTSGGAFRE